MHNSRLRNAPTERPGQGPRGLGLREPQVAREPGNRALSRTAEREVVNPDSGVRFRFESDMIPSLRLALPRLVFGHRPSAAVEVFSEVPAVHGVPDLAAVRFDQGAIERRRSAGVRPLTTDTEVRAVAALGPGPTCIRDLASRLRMTHDYVRRAIIPLLAERGWVFLSDDQVALRPDAAWVSRRVVTVEAKLRDWQRAIAQARRQQLSADAAYIALDSQACRNIENDLGRISDSGVGVISVSAETGVSRVLIRPRVVPRRLTFVGRMLVAERCLEMWDRGEREGQIYPVFGWTQTAPIN